VVVRRDLNKNNVAVISGGGSGMNRRTSALSVKAC
jgi:hypothetical protein